MFKSSLCYLVERTNLLLLLFSFGAWVVVLFFKTLSFRPAWNTIWPAAAFSPSVRPSYFVRRKGKQQRVSFLHVTSSQSKAAKTNERKTKIWSVKQINRLLIFTPPSHIPYQRSPVPIQQFQCPRSWIASVEELHERWMQCPTCEFEFENKINCA